MKNWAFMRGRLQGRGGLDILSIGGVLRGMGEERRWGWKERERFLENGVSKFGCGMIELVLCRR